MIKNPSLTTRILIGKVVGFALGVVGFVALPAFYPEASTELRLGVLFWYATVGAVIGVFGIYTRHPVLKFPMPWWFRAPIIGAWMNLVLTLIAIETMERMMTAVFGVGSFWSSPYWLVLEGAVVGALIGYLATKLGGEGAETAAEG